MSNIEKDLNPDVFIGVSLPLDYGGQGFFNKTRTTLQQTRSNIKNLLLTIKGERLGNPTFGSDLMTVIFEQDDGTLGNRIEEAIRGAADNFLPYINIINVFTIQEQNQVNVQIEFSVPLNPDTIEILNFDFRIGE